MVRSFRVVTGWAGFKTSCGDTIEYSLLISAQQVLADNFLHAHTIRDAIMLDDKATWSTIGFSEEIADLLKGRCIATRDSSEGVSE
jgi:hypothetical protein